MVVGAWEAKLTAPRRGGGVTCFRSAYDNPVPSSVRNTPRPADTVDTGQHSGFLLVNPLPP